ncbi:hypothetical protein V6N13_109479 [Hibiscus sabdariffa]
MLAAAVVRPCLLVLVVVVLALQLTGWCIPVVSLSSVPGVAWHDACCLPSLHAIRDPGWCTTCMCPSIVAWPMIGLLNNALIFKAASSCRGRSGTIRVPFPDARHSLALLLHCLVVSNDARHLPIMEVFLHTVQPLWLRFSGSIHNMRTWYVHALAGRLPALVAPCTAAQACSLRCTRCTGTVPCAPAPLLGSPRPLPRAMWPDCISPLADWNLAQCCSNPLFLCWPHGRPDQAPAFGHVCTPCHGLVPWCAIVAPAPSRYCPSDGQKLQYSAWMPAPQPKRPTTSRPRGRVSLVADAVNATAPAPSAVSGSPISGASAMVTSSASDAATPLAADVSPTAPVTSSAPSGRPSPMAPASSAPAVADPEHGPYDPMINPATSDMLEDALAIPADCALLVDIDRIVQANGEDLVHGAIDEAADSLIREVAASVLGCTPLSVGTDATVAPVTLAATPTAPGLSRSAPAYARRLPMPALPEHQEFDACANNSSAETARQSRREK